MLDCIVTCGIGIGIGKGYINGQCGGGGCERGSSDMYGFFIDGFRWVSRGGGDFGRNSSIPSFCN